MQITQKPTTGKFAAVLQLLALPVALFCTEGEIGGALWILVLLLGLPAVSLLWLCGGYAATQYAHQLAMTALSHSTAAESDAALAALRRQFEATGQPSFLKIRLSRSPAPLYSGAKVTYTTKADLGPLVLLPAPATIPGFTKPLQVSLTSSAATESRAAAAP